MLYGINYWINDICNVWAEVNVKNQRVVSFPDKKNEMPGKIPQFPCALSFVTNTDISYSLAGSCNAVYKGKTDFHITPDLDHAKLNTVMSFIDPIITAAAGHLTLGGKVTSFHLERTNSIEVVELKWGGEFEHLGLEIFWRVEENQSGKLVASP